MKLKKIFFLCVLLACSFLLYSLDFSYGIPLEIKHNLVNQTTHLLNLLIVLNDNLQNEMPESNEINELLKLYRQISKNQKKILESLKKTENNSTQLTDDLENTNKENEIENEKETELLMSLEKELLISKEILKKYRRWLWIERIIAGLISGGCFYLGFKAGQNF